MKLIAAALALLLLPAASRAASFDDLTTDAATQGLLLRMRQAAAATPSPAPAASSYHPVARLELGADTDYWRTSVTFKLRDGRVVHVSGNKDRSQGDHDGYFMSFLIDGAAQPIWVAPDKKPVRFQIDGDTYSVIVHVGSLFNPFNDIKLLAHPENIKLTITRPGDASFRLDFTAGVLINAMRETGRSVMLGNRDYYVSYVQDIRENKADPVHPVVLLPSHTLWIMPGMDPRPDGHGGVNYKFGWNERLEIGVCDAEGVDASGAPRLAFPIKKKDDADQNVSPWAFHVGDGPAGDKFLDVYSLAQ